MCHQLFNKQSFSQFFHILQCRLVNGCLLRKLLRLRILGLILFNQLTIVIMREQMPAFQTVLQSQQRNYSSNRQRKHHPNNNKLHTRTLFLHCEVRLTQIYLNRLVYISQLPQSCPLLEDNTNYQSNKQWI